MPKQDKLLAQLHRYYECLCGQVIDDSTTAKDLEHAGGGWGMMIPCPKCGSRATKRAFPPVRFRPLFEMMAECFQLKRAILVLILSQTTFEAMLGDLICGIFDRRSCDPDISFAVISALGDMSTTNRLVEELTGKTVYRLLKDVGYKGMANRLSEIRYLRNSFLHSAEQKKELTMDHM